MLTIDQLKFSYGRQDVLNDLSLSIRENHYFALAGLNGSGKTTLIKLILDLLRSSARDTIQLNGVSSWDVDSRKELIYLPEKFNLKPHTTAWDYFKLLAGVYRQKLNKNKVLELCADLNFAEHKLSEKSVNYSKGMMQKVGLIGCLILEVRFLLFDEPFSGLDPKARFQIKKILLDENKNSPKTMLYSTHMLADVEDLCDSFGILHQGRLQFNGTPRQCISSYKAESLEQAFLACVNDQ